jgi:hypothetical protein
MPAEALPARIGRYEIVAELARGSMGRVLRARDPNVDRPVALKVLAPLHLVSAEGEAENLRQRFLLEAQAAGRLSHSGIVTVFDADTDPATLSPYIAMELVEGRSLESLLQEHGRLPLKRAVEIAIQVARALAYAHRQGVIHRDVKPANILVSDQGPVKVSDFGIAKLASQSLTVTGYVLGSPFFMSPEQVCGEPVDARTDLFSLGSVLYRAVTGAFPFEGDSIAAVTFRVVNGEPEPARLRVPAIPPCLAAAIDRALAKDRARRFQDGDEMAAALEAVALELRGESPATAAGVASLEPAAPAGGPATATTGAARPAAAPAAAPEPGTVALARPPPRPPARAAERPSRPAAARKGALLGAAAVLLAVLAVLLALRDEGAGAGGTGSGSATGAPAAEAGSLPEVPPPPPSASLDLVYNNRLASGTISVWVDGERVWSGDVGGSRSVLQRVAGRELRQTLEITPGDRTVEVRITGRAARLDVDAADQIRGRFEPDQARGLRVALNPVTNRLKLSWVD